MTHRPGSVSSCPPASPGAASPVAVARLALAALLALAGVAPAPAAQTMKLSTPATTGIPGEEVRIVRFAPDGLLWVGARWPFWGDGGIGKYDRASDLWTTRSNRDGLFPSAFPNDVAWTADGTAWVATDNGLLRWKDDVQTLWTTANAPLLHNGIRNLAVDDAGVVWVNNSSVQSGAAAIFRFDGTTWTKFQVGAQLPWATPWYALSDVLVDRDNHVWVANEVLNGVAEYDGVTWKLWGANAGRFGEIREDAAGNLWFRAGVGGGNSFWKFDHVSFTQFGAATTPTSIGIDDDGAVYLGDWNGLVRKTVNGGQSFTTFVNGLNHVFEIEPDPASTDVWIGTPGAVGHFSGAGALLRDYNTTNTGMPDYFIERFSVDRSGNLWLASGETGLSRFDGLRWRNWGLHNAGSEPWPFGGNEPMGVYFEDSTGTGWMGGNGIARWNPQTGQFTGFWNWQNNPGMGVTLFDFMAEDASGKVFAATHYGAIFSFNGSLWVPEPVGAYAPLSLPGMQADSQGHVWVCAWFALHEWNGSRWTKHDTDADLFGLGGANGFAIDADDVLWIGTEGGLVRWDGTSSTLYTTANSPMPTNAVKAIAFRDDGVMALSCSKFSSVTPFEHGVVVIDGDIDVAANWKQWQYGTSPLPHYQLGDVEFDAEGNLWVSAVSEGAAVLLNPAQPLALDGQWLSASEGGAVGFALDAGPGNAGRNYALVGSVTGTAPGLPLPGGQVTLPVNWDAFSQLTLAYANTPVFPGFLGTLDALGRATATLDSVGTLPASVAGLTMHFAFGVSGPWNLVSNPVAVRLQP